jgi:tRNA(Arg) A34 adenosine deaminase TadA
MNQHQKYMARAIELSEENITKGGGPFGAVIVKNNEIIAEGYNQVTTSLDPTAHAEVTAIRNAAKKLNNFDLSGCIIYSSCEPCPMCLAAIYWAKIDTIYFGNSKQDADQIGFSDNFIYQEINKPLNKRSIPVFQLMNEEAKTAFALWTKKDNKTIY